MLQDQGVRNQSVLGDLLEVALEGEDSEYAETLEIAKNVAVTAFEGALSSSALLT